MSARADRHNDGVRMQRTMFLVDDRRLSRPVVVDLFRLASETEHSYDYPIHFRGQMIATDVRYKSHSNAQSPLGKAFGYQHIWKEAEGSAAGPVRMTWLDGNRYYTATTATGGPVEVIFGRTGANDSSFNLVSEPMMIVRAQGRNQLFASVIEPHGYFNEAEERSLQARPSTQSIRVLAHSDSASVIEVTATPDIRWVLMVNNGTPSATARHRISADGRTWEWTGNFRIDGVMAR
jgi:hypothetical protein